MWKAIPGYGGYEASDDGRVRSVDRWIVFADGRRRFYRGQQLSDYPGTDDYRRVTLKIKSVAYRENIHVLVALAFHGPCPPGLWVCHNNGIGSDNRKDNLRYDTPTGNALDRWTHGTMVECLPHRIADDKVREIRAASGTVDALATAFNVSRTTVWNLRNGKRRAFLK